LGILTPKTSPVTAMDILYVGLGLLWHHKNRHGCHMRMTPVQLSAEFRWHCDTLKHFLH